MRSCATALPLSAHSNKEEKNFGESSAQSIHKEFLRGAWGLRSDRETGILIEFSAIRELQQPRARAPAPHGRW